MVHRSWISSLLIELKKGMRLLRHTMNRARLRRLICALTACAVATTPTGFAACAELPELGEVAKTVISAQQQRRIGETIMREIRADRSLIRDVEITDYINNLGYRLVAQSAGSGQDFEFFVLRDSTINAFALPGAFIGVHTGLILTAQSESELASVVAHEVAHVTQAHIARIIAKSEQSTVLSMAALALAMLAARSNPQIARAAVATAQATSLQSQLDYTRDHEREADRVGLAVMQQGGFDPLAMPAFFERMLKYNRLYESNAPDYLRTHPITTERISDIKNRTEDIPFRFVNDSPEFHFVRAKLRAAEGSPREALRYFEDNLREKKYASETAHRYGLALALARNREYARAQQELAASIKKSGMNAMAATARGDIQSAAGQSEPAAKTYREGLQRFPRHRALSYGLAEILLQTGKPREALGLVNEQLVDIPPDAQLYELKSRAHADLNQPFARHQALAEAYALRGNNGAAIEQLQLALKSSGGDFYQMSGAEARMRQLQQLEIPPEK